MQQYSLSFFLIPSFAHLLQFMYDTPLLSAPFLPHAVVVNRIVHTRYQRGVSPHQSIRHTALVGNGVDVAGCSGISVMVELLAHEHHAGRNAAVEVICLFTAVFGKQRRKILHLEPDTVFLLPSVHNDRNKMPRFDLSNAHARVDP